MAPLLSADGERVNWVAYKTGEKGMGFRMEVDSKSAYIGIELSHPDTAVRELQYLQLLELQPLLQKATAERWNWQPATRDSNDRPVARVGTSLADVSVFRQEDWPALIQFFKPRLMALDAFWSEAKYAFEALRS